MYLEIDDGFLEHPKTLRFCRAVRDLNGAAYVMRLWTWATKSAPDGDLSELEPEDVETPLRWPGERGVLYAALVDCGFIDELEGGIREIHNWGERTGGAIIRMRERAVEKRDSWREQKRRQRQARGEAVTPEPEPLPMSAECPPGQPADVRPCPPPQDKTRQDETRQDEPSAPDPRAHDPYAGAPGVAIRDVRSAPAQLVLADPAPPAAPWRNRPKPPAAHEVARFFGQVRAHVLPRKLEWHTPGTNMIAKADVMLGGIRGSPALGELERAMFLFFERVAARAEDHGDPRLDSDVNFAFGAFLARLPQLLEDLCDQRGARPAQRIGKRASEALAIVARFAGGT